MRPLRRLASLSRHEQCLVLQAGCWLVAVRLGLWLCPFRLVWHLTNVAGRPRPGPVARREPPALVCWAVQAAGRYVPAATCLTRSLALYGLLRRQGLAAQLRLGVRRSGRGRLVAHAWVEWDGVPLPAGEDVGGYVPLPALPGGRP
jgi:hypothetical protein